jgi:hypothetical protein
MLLPGMKHIGFADANNLRDASKASECRRIKDSIAVALECLPLIIPSDAVPTALPLFVQPVHAGRLAHSFRRIQAKLASNIYRTPV